MTDRIERNSAYAEGKYDERSHLDWYKDNCTEFKVNLSGAIKFKTTFEK
jgi:hypothetical protein